MAKKTVSRAARQKPALKKTSGKAKNSATAKKATSGQAAKTSANSKAKLSPKVKSQTSLGRKTSAKSRREPSNSSHVKRNSSQAVVSQVRNTLEKLAERVAGLFTTRPKDIATAIRMDHESLRNFMDLLKDTDRDMTERRRGYALFSDLLKSHSECEEAALYVPSLEMAGREIHIKVAEGYVEHQLANDLMKRIEAADEALEWSAHVNVLSEIIEHHLKEEERDLLPAIRKVTDAQLDAEMLSKFLEMRDRTQSRVTEKNAGAIAGYEAESKTQSD